MKKIKKFQVGGMPDYEREPDEQDRKQQEAAVAKYNDQKAEEAIMSKPLAKASFKEAFADARKSGDKTFEYMGKKYSTEMATSTPKTKTTSSPVTPKEIGFKSSPRMSAEDRVKKERGMKAGGKVRGCGIARKGLTKGKIV